MLCTIHRLRRLFAPIGLSSMLALGVLAGQVLSWNAAEAAQPPAGSSAAAPSASAQAATRGPDNLASLVETRIADLRARLAITPAEEPRFTALADVMRANARSMMLLLRKRVDDTDATAVDSLRWNEQLTEAHAAALRKFVPVFAELYAILSDSQRKAADAIFAQFAERPVPPKSP